MQSSPAPFVCVQVRTHPTKTLHQTSDGPSELTADLCDPHLGDLLTVPLDTHRRLRAVSSRAPRGSRSQTTQQHSLMLAVGTCPFCLLLAKPWNAKLTPQYQPCTGAAWNALLPSCHRWHHGLHSPSFILMSSSLQRDASESVSSRLDKVRCSGWHFPSPEARASSSMNATYLPART